MDTTSLGDRMKQNYEDRYRIKLTRRMPVILRLDGRAFHSLKLQKPFDDDFIRAIDKTARTLVQEVQGAVLGYVQSDEISLFLIDYQSLGSHMWFDGNVQKMCSIAASIASTAFTAAMWWKAHERMAVPAPSAHFDCRAFNVPKEEVANYFLWRQQDWVRNSVSMLAQSQFSQAQLHKKNQAAMHDMLHEKGINWAHLAPALKNGSFVFPGNPPQSVGIHNLREDREWLEKLIHPESQEES